LGRYGLGRYGLGRYGLGRYGLGRYGSGRDDGAAARLTVVRNGVDLARFTPAGGAERTVTRARLGVGAGAPLAVCVGRLTRQKGQDVLLDAWPRVRARCPDAELVLVGGGDAHAALACRRVPGVRLVGPCLDVRPWYAAADVVVLPSRWEGLALTALEALARGRPVVASAIPGLAEAVPAEVGGLVPPEDPPRLADALAAVLAESRGDPDRARERGRFAAAHAAAHFDRRHTFDRLAAVTAEVATHRGSPAGG
jgi:glycosyltransferase involved in cell wall biosynthesis